MNTLITITKIDGGFSIKFPYELKDRFRSEFPSAKWNPAEKRWEVGPRSGKRLEQWAAVMQPLADDMAVADQVEYDQAELARLNEQIRRVRREIEIRRGNAEKAAAVAAALAQAKQEIAALQEELARARQDEEAARLRIEAQIAGVLDVPAIEAAHKEMRQQYNRVGAVARQKWEKARAVFLGAEETLERLGLVSSGISQLAHLNFNRPDRDDPHDVTSCDLRDFRVIG